MPIFLFLVKEVFTIHGRGIVLGPGVGETDLRLLKVGSRITLESPDGTSRQVRIQGFEIPFPNPRRAVLILLKGLKKDGLSRL